MKNTNTQLAILKVRFFKQKGDYFGEYGFVTGSKRKGSAKSLEFCELYVIYRSDFIEYLKIAT